MATKEHNRAIARAMEFTAKDLTLNQRGELSPTQQQKLIVMRDMFISDIYEAPPLHVPSAFILITLAVSAAILDVLGAFNRLHQEIDAWYRPLLVGVGLLILGWFLWRQVRYWIARAVLPDMIDDMIQTPALHSVTGEARLSAEHSLGQTSYWLMIGDLRFPLTTSAADVFQDGRTYRVFYIHFADATVMMSAEWLNDHNP